MNNIKRTGYDWFNNVMNKPRFICSPMVDQSEGSSKICFRLD